MGARTDNPTSFRFSTELLPARDRMPAFREWYGREMLRAELTPVAEDGFYADIILHALPRLCVTLHDSSPVRFERTPKLVADGVDDLAFVLNRSDSDIVSEQNGRDTAIGLNQAILLSSGHVGFGTMTATRSRTSCLVVPRASLAPIVTDIDDAINRPIAADNVALGLLRGYLSTLSKSELPSDAMLQGMIETHITDLIAAAIGMTANAWEIAKDRGMRAARLAAIKAAAIANLGRHDLSPTVVASAQGITVRYLHSLFSNEDRSFMDFVLEQRLVHAHRMLNDRRFAGRTISAIAYEAGFGDLSYFNRTFRRRYGATPSDVREKSRRE